MTSSLSAADDPVLMLAAQAKVNLALAVTGVRPDGYHELCSVFLRLELADTLSVSALPGTYVADVLTIDGDADCPVADNLVLRATTAFRDQAAGRGVAVPLMRIELTKRIPMAAGLAGGSTDAAAMFRLLAARQPGILPRSQLASLAAAVGSDVPFFLDGAGAALVSGVGESVEPLPSPIDPVGVLLVRPPVGASTPAVFRAWDAMHTSMDLASDEATMDVVDDLARLLRAGASADSLSDRATDLRAANALWLPAVALTPGLRALRESLEQLLGRPILLTGSGSTLFALYPCPESADDDASRLRSEASYAAVRIMATRSTGPHPSVITSRRDP